jgi:hypothetical protein
VKELLFVAKQRDIEDAEEGEDALKDISLERSWVAKQRPLYRARYGVLATTSHFL